MCPELVFLFFHSSTESDYSGLRYWSWTKIGNRSPSKYNMHPHNDARKRAEMAHRNFQNKNCYQKELLTTSQRQNDRREATS